MDRKDELLKTFKDNVEPSQYNVVIRLIDEAVFLEEQMTDLRKLPFIKVHPEYPEIQKKTEAAKLYKECSQSYMNAVRILCSLLQKQDDSAENELLKKLGDFKL